MIFWHNNSYIPENEKQFSIQERLLRYGDGFFESIVAINTRVLWVLEHYARIIASSKTLKLELPDSFTQDFFAQVLDELLHKNDIQNARFRVVVYRQGEGLYAPEQNKAGIFITVLKSAPIQNLSAIDKMVVYSENKKVLGNLANIKSCNALLYVLASLYAKENKAQEAVILNSENNICETISTNLFVLNGNKISTPPLSAGCIAGVMRSKLLSALTETFEVKEENISLEHLYEAEAVFLSNVSKGVQVVKAIENKMYLIDTVNTIYAIYQKMLQNELA